MRTLLRDLADRLYHLSERVAGHPRYGDWPGLQLLDAVLEGAFHRLIALSRPPPVPPPTAPQPALMHMLALLGELDREIAQFVPSTVSEFRLKNAAGYHLAEAAALLQQLQQQQAETQPPPPLE